MDSMACIEFWESVYMTQLFPSLFFISYYAVFIAVISAVCIEASSESAPFLVGSGRRRKVTLVDNDEQ